MMRFDGRNEGRGTATAAASEVGFQVAERPDDVGLTARSESSNVSRSPSSVIRHDTPYGGGIPEAPDTFGEPATPETYRKGAEHLKVDWLLAQEAAGRLSDLPDLVLPPEPERMSPGMRAVWRFFVRVCRVRAWAEDDRPVPFACAWVGGHLRMPAKKVWRSLRRLEAAGLMDRVDPGDSAYPPDHLMHRRGPGRKPPTHYRPLLPSEW